MEIEVEAEGEGDWEDECGGVDQNGELPYFICE